MGIDAAGSGEFSASAALHADSTVQGATRVEYPDRVSELARFGINWVAPMPLAVIASLILSASKASTLTSEAGKGLPFWTKMRALHGPEDRNEFSRRTATWSRLAAAGLEFYR
jgi:hypothetical protein